MNDAGNVKRSLHVRVRTPMADPSQFLVALKAAIPVYEALGNARIRLLRNVDDPTAFVQIVEYQTDEALELNRQRLASDPMMRSYMQGWRMLTAGAVEIDVYEDVTDTV